jgi:hypothetical protein
MWHIVKRLHDNDWALSRRVVYPTTVGAFVMGVVPVDSNCRSPGEIFVDACLPARSSDTASYLQLKSLIVLATFIK